MHKGENEYCIGPTPRIKRIEPLETIFFLILLLQVAAIIDATELLATDPAIAGVKAYEITKLVSGGNTDTATLSVAQASGTPSDVPLEKIGESTDGATGPDPSTPTISPDNVAVSLTDFVALQGVIDTALLKLQDKINSINSQGPLTCPT